MSDRRLSKLARELEPHLRGGGGSGGGGTLRVISTDNDHSLLINLDADDHPQYLTAARGQNLFYLESEVDALLAPLQAAQHDPVTSPLGSLGGDFAAQALDINLAHANIWTARQTFDGDIGATGDMVIDVNKASDTAWLFVSNQAAGGSASLSVEGDIALGGKIDGVNLFEHTLDKDAHHPEIHVLATDASIGPSHTISGGVAGYVLRATGPTTAKLMELSHTDLGDITPSDHHDPVTTSDPNLVLSVQDLALGPDVALKDIDNQFQVSQHVTGSLYATVNVDATGDLIAHDDLQVASGAILGALGTPGSGLALDVRGASKLVPGVEIDGLWDFTAAGEMRSKSPAWSITGQGTNIAQEAIYTQLFDAEHGALNVGVLRYEGTAINSGGEQWLPGSASTMFADVTFTPLHPILRVLFDWDNDARTDRDMYYQHGQPTISYWSSLIIPIDNQFGRPNSAPQLWEDLHGGAAIEVDFGTLTIPQSGTVSLFVQLGGEYGAASGTPFLVTDSGGIDVSNSVKVAIAAGTLTLSVGDSSASGGITLDQSAGSVPQWFHVAGTWDASGIALYLDGVSIGTGAASSIAVASGARLYFENSDGMAISDVTLFDSAMTSAQIAEMNNLWGRGVFGQISIPITDSIIAHARQYDVGERVQISGFLERIIPDSTDPYTLFDPFTGAFKLSAPRTSSKLPTRVWGTVVSLSDDSDHFSYTVSLDREVLGGEATLPKGSAVAGYKRPSTSNPQGLMLVDASDGAYAPYQAGAVLTGDPWDPTYRFAAGNLGGFAVGRTGEFATAMGVDLNDDTQPYVIVSDQRVDIVDPTLRVKGGPDRDTLLSIDGDGLNIYTPVQHITDIVEGDPDAWWADDALTLVDQIVPTWSGIQFTDAPDNLKSSRIFGNIIVRPYGVGDSPDSTYMTVSVDGGQSMNRLSLRAEPVPAAGQDAHIDIYSNSSGGNVEVSGSNTVTVLGALVKFIGGELVLDTSATVLKNLPTTSTGLKSGQVWNDAGTLKVVT